MGNRVIGNDVHHLMSELSDGSGIYTLGFIPGMEVSENYVHDILRAPTVIGAGNSGIFFDQLSKGAKVSRNVVRRVASWKEVDNREPHPIKHHRNVPEDHTFIGNDSDAGDTPIRLTEVAAKAGLRPLEAARQSKKAEYREAESVPIKWLAFLLCAGRFCPMDHVTSPPKWALPGLIALTLLAHGLCLTCGFTNWDDPALVTENPRIQSLDIGLLLRPVPGRSYQPVRELSHALDIAIWGDNAFGHHALNLLLHLAATLLLAQLVITLMRQCKREDQAVPTALIVAGLFAVHPVNVEAVAWVSSRKYGLAAVGIFGACLCHLCGLRKSALAAAVFAILSSPFGIVLPALFVTLDYARHGKATREHWKTWLPVAIAALLMLLLMRTTLLAETGLARSESVRAGPATMASSIFDMLQHLLLPINLGVRYLSQAADFANWRVYAALAAIIGAIVLAVRRRDRVLTAGLLWFAICWAPVSGIIPTSTFLADRYSYLSAIGLFLALATFAKSATWHKAIALVLVLFAIMSLARTRIWMDSESLWRAEIARQPKHEIARYNLALALLESDPNEAYEQLESAIEIRSSYIAPYLVLGKHFDNPEILGEAVLLAPESALAAAAYGESLLAQERYEEACAQLERSLTLNSDMRDAMPLLATGYLRLGRFEYALKMIDHALSLEPEAPHLLAGKGIILSETDALDEAVVYLKRSGSDREAVLRLLRRNARRVFLERPDSAISALRTALALAPELAGLHAELASAYFQLGKLPEAIAAQREAIILAPTSPDHLANLGGMLATNRQFEAARQALEQALALDPNNERARANLLQLRRDTGQ